MATAQQTTSFIDSLKAKSQYLSGTIGGAYKINNMFSVSLAGRYVNGVKEFDISSTQAVTGLSEGTNIAKVEMNTWGLTGIIGVDVTPMEGLNIGLRYESETSLEWDTEVSGAQIALAQGLGYVDGGTEKKNLPQLASIGIAYNILPELKASASFTYYMIKWSTWEHDNGTETNEDYDNGFDAAISLEYSIHA